MGKQINYYMEYESFLKIAQKALDLGFEIIRKNKKTGEYVISRNIDVVEEGCRNYYFHLPAAGDVVIVTKEGVQYLDHGYSASGNTIVEAGFSCITDNNEDEKKLISRARLFCITGYYDGSGEFIPRSDCMTKAFNSLVRIVKKTAPYTEITDKRSENGEDYLNEVEYKYKVYISRRCLDLKYRGYKLG